MSLGPQVPEWKALADELESVVQQLAATNVVVTDAWGHLWCRGIVIPEGESGMVHDLIADVLRSAPRPLERGGKMDRAHVEARGAWYTRSFAGVYLVLAWWLEDRLRSERVRESREPLARTVIARHLPRIEALTLKLPPPDGPQITSGAAAKRIA